MVRILVPSEQIVLTGEIQHALLVAELQGLVINEIELGVSPSQYIQVVIEQSSLSIGSDLWSSDIEGCDFYLSYTSGITPCNQSMRRNQIIIGWQDNNSLLDVWLHPLSGETRALSTENHTEHLDAKSHLSWLVALLSLGFPIEDGLTLARAKMNVSRETWPSNYKNFPRPIIQDSRLAIAVGWSKQTDMPSFGELHRSSLGLYPVVNNVAWVEALLKLGVTTLQLRIKDPNTSDLESQIAGAIKLGKEYQAQVFINDHWQFAIKYQAFGVHLGQEDLEHSNLEKLRDAHVQLGLSTHGYYELLRIIQLKPSYIALGHIFPTTTKKMPSKPQGLVRLSLYQALIDTIPYGDQDLNGGEVRYGYPTVAIGGIDLNNAHDVWSCGVSSLAVVRAITLADNPAQVLQRFASIMQENGERKERARAN